MFILMISLGMFNRITSPELFGWDEYEIAGVGGLLGTTVAVFTSTATWVFGQPVLGGIQPMESGESLIVLGTIALPFTFVFYELYRPSLTAVGVTRNDNPTHDPEFVRDKTAQWSTSDPEDFIQRDRTATDTSNNDENTEVRSIPGDSSYDLEFCWTTETGVDFDDVGGMNDLKNELERDVIKPLTTHREEAEKLGVTAPNIIFHGPPGTGKTYLAKALATELGLPFVQLSGADIQSKWINESAQKVQTLFKEAETVAKRKGGAVIFLDELDSVLKNRDGGGNTHEEDNKVVNEFLNYLEDADKHDIVFIGATNRLESLDEAGIRAGRIDKKVHIGKPDTDARALILEAQLDPRPHRLSKDEVLRAAVETDGLTAADLESVIKTAAKYTLERDDSAIEWEDVVQAIRDVA